MLTKKKKLSKKEIKEDKLVSFYYKAYGFIDENKTRVIIYAGALVVLIVAAVLYVNYRSQQNQLASFELSKVMPVYDQGSYLEAIEGKQGSDVMGLKKIVSEYGSTEAGETAKIYLANSYNRLGKTDDALKYYEDYDGDISIFKATALAGQAGYYESQKDYAKAADLYKKAARVSENNVLNPDYLLYAGIDYLNAEKEEDAKQMFDSIKKNYESSPAAREASRYMAQVD